MAVTSREVKSNEAGNRAARDQRPRLDPPGLALSGVGTLLSLVLWVIGARYTVDGVLAMINALLDFLTIPAQIPIPPGWVLYLMLAPIPLAYSLIEWQKVPLTVHDEGWRAAPLGQWVVWLIVYAMDAITTWNGLGVVDRSAPLIVQQLSAALAGRVVMTAVLTIGPEALLRSMASIFRRALGKR
jgi:hypothetical protein